MRTLDEMIEYLEERKDVDEIVELLELTPRDILTRFDDKVSDMLDYLNEECFDEPE